MRDIRVGHIGGMALYADILLIPGAVVLFAVLGLLGESLLQMPREVALGAALVATLLHYLSVLVHQLGHAWAASRTGYPMNGIRIGFLGVLGSTLYPSTEPELPAAIHIRRALGGPLGSTALSLVAFFVWLILREFGDAPNWIGLFFFLDNLLALGLGALLPLNFADGSTLKTWWGKR